MKALPRRWRDLIERFRASAGLPMKDLGFWIVICLMVLLIMSLFSPRLMVSTSGSSGIPEVIIPLDVLAGYLRYFLASGIWFVKRL